MENLRYSRLESLRYETRYASDCAFSLIEILITIGLLSFIVLGLLAMFNQTQRAFTSSMTQTDVLESGRATMDMWSRELAQMTPSEFPNVTLNSVPYRATNFFVEPSAGFFKPFTQELPGNPLARTNFIQRFFFLTKVNQDWIGIGYQVIPDDGNGCVGTLYRFASTNLFRSGPYLSATGDFLQAAGTSYLNGQAGLPITNVLMNSQNSPFSTPRTTMINRVADGIVHLRVRAFAANGALIVTNGTPGLLAGTNGVFAILPRPLNGPAYTNVLDSNVSGSLFDWAQSSCYLTRETVPAYLEVELGVLEPGVLKKYHSIPIGTVARQYLSNHVAQVHIFRQRIPVANVDFAAYP